jgi:hypothetical protein
MEQRNKREVRREKKQNIKNKGKGKVKKGTGEDHIKSVCDPMDGFPETSADVTLLTWKIALPILEVKVKVSLYTPWWRLGGEEV